MSTVDRWNRDALTYIVGRVQGWWDPRLIPFYNAIRHFHLEDSVRGNLMEIGSYHGRSFLPLALMARDTERAVAVDDGSYADDALATLRKHADTIGIPSRLVATYGSDSSRADRAWFGSCRVCSVDGDHTVNGTYRDIDLCASILVPRGVLIVDDVWNPAWPSVTEGLYRWFLTGRPWLGSPRAQKSGYLLPVAYVHGRTFFVSDGGASDLRARFLALDEKPTRESTVFDFPFLSWV